MDAEAFREFRADSNAIADTAREAASAASAGPPEYVGAWIVIGLNALTQSVLLVARELHHNRNK